MIVYVFGNPDLEQDSLPIKILPELEKQFPQIEFAVKDPNEEWEVPEELTVIDAVQGIDAVTVFDGLEQFAASPRVSLHDYDALANLLYLKKLGKLKNAKIIGIPPEFSEPNAIKEITQQLLHFSKP